MTGDRIPYTAIENDPAHIIAHAAGIPTSRAHAALAALYDEDWQIVRTSDTDPTCTDPSCCRPTRITRQWTPRPRRTEGAI